MVVIRLLQAFTIGVFVGGSMAFSPTTTTTTTTTTRSITTTRTRTTTERMTPTTTTTTLLAGGVDVSESASRDVNTFQEWAMSAAGIQRIPGLELMAQETPNPLMPAQDWGFVTSVDLPARTSILYVPQNVLLSWSSLRQECTDAVDTLNRLGAGDQVPQFLLFVCILMEYQQGDQSPYFPWLNSLPRLYFNAVSMTNFCYECVPPLVFALARIERVKYENFCTALEQLKNMINPAIISNTDVTKWAYNVVSTRCIDQKNKNDNNKNNNGQELLLAPMADMFNHGTDPEIMIDFDDSGNCVAYTIKDVPAGSPLRVSYGDPTNPSKLFATYGFLDQTSPATFCKLMLTPTPQLRDLGYDHSRMLFYKDTGGISQEVWDVVLYQHLASKRDIQQAFYNAHMQGDQATKAAIHQEYMQDTCASLQSHVNTFLKQLDELSNKAKGKDLQEHPRLPLIMQHNEFVKSTFLTVKSQLDAMVPQGA